MIGLTNNVEHRNQTSEQLKMTGHLRALTSPKPALPTSVVRVYIRLHVRACVCTPGMCVRVCVRLHVYLHVRASL